MVPMDGTQIVRLLKSTAFTQAMAESIQIEWKTTEMGWASPLYAVASLWGKEGPGAAELNMKRGKELLPRTEQLLGMYLKGFERALDRGPAAVYEYLNRAERLRNTSRDNINKALQEVQEINRDVAAQLGEAIRNAALIRASATIALSLLGAGVGLYSLALGTAAGMGIGGAGAAGWAATAGTAGWVGTGYGIAGALVKNWNEVPAARAVLISPVVDDVGGEFVKWNDLTDKGLEFVQNKAATSRDLHQRAADFLNGAIRRRAQTLMATAPGPAQQQAQKTLDRFVAATARPNAGIARTKLATGGLGALRGFLCVYVAYSDIQGAMNDYREAVAASR
jgi:hypothetical protein